MADTEIRDAIRTLRRYADMLTLDQLDELDALVRESRRRRAEAVGASMPLDEFLMTLPRGAGKRLRNAIRLSGLEVTTLADLVAHSPHELLVTPRIGWRTVESVQRRFRELGIAAGTPWERWGPWDA